MPSEGGLPSRERQSRSGAAGQLPRLLSDFESGGQALRGCQEGQKEGAALGCLGVLLGEKGGSAFSHLSSQERVNKKQKTAAPAEEDDSGVEVYYREGEEETEATSVLPRVRDSSARGVKAALTPAYEVGCRWQHPLRSHVLGRRPSLPEEFQEISRNQS